MIVSAIDAAPAKDLSSAQVWLRALELTAPIVRHPHRLLLDVLEEIAEKSGDSPALVSDRQSFTYRQLTQRIRQYARWARKQGIEKGDVVGVLMTNQPDYFAIWMGIASVGGVAALLNTNLTGSSLAHCIGVVRPKCIVVSDELAEGLQRVLVESDGLPPVWIHDPKRLHHNGEECDIAGLSSDPLTAAEREQLTVEDCALYIFTSGTTGLPKAANVSHARILQWSFWFAGMTGMEPSDRMYNCLPMYHSIGGVLAPGAALVAGASVAVREKFSANEFWADVERWDCTLFQYIGEFCRYLLNSAQSHEAKHRLRLACGNGLSVDVWEKFQERFRIPRILEFYASTEGGVSLFNVEEKPGAIGRIPPYLAQRFSPVLVRIDAATEQPVRGAEGLCVPCGANEAGEALGRGVADLTNLGTRFEGYTDEAASEKKVLHDVLKHGDMWIRTGDLMLKDEKGFFYFVDRIGDTFRWKGENVATSEVARVLCGFPGVRHAIVYGVAIPGTEGRAGMAAITTESEIDLTAFRKYLVDCLPSYARPLFLRLQSEVQVTGTLKYSKVNLVREGYDCLNTTDTIYFDDREQGMFRPLTREIHRRIHLGEIRF